MGLCAPGWEAILVRGDFPMLSMLQRTCSSERVALPILEAGRDSKDGGKTVALIVGESANKKGIEKAAGRACR